MCFFFPLLLLHVLFISRFLNQGSFSTVDKRQLEQSQTVDALSLLSVLVSVYTRLAEKK